MSKTVVVTGAGGTTGSEVVKQLSAAGRRVRAVLHAGESVRGLPQRNVETVGADYDQPATLDAAFKGATAVYALVPVSPHAVRWSAGIVDAAKRTGVPHVVRHSGMGASHDSPAELIRDHATSDDYLRASGLQHTILQPNSFMQNLLGSADSIRGQGVFHLAMGSARQSVIDVGDIAAVAVKVLTAPGHDNRTYVLTGPESLTYAEQADALGRALGKPVKYVAVPPDEVERTMKANGAPAWLAHGLAEFFAAIATGAYAPTTSDVETVLGRKATPFRTFVERQLALFQ